MQVELRRRFQERLGVTAWRGRLDHVAEAFASTSNASTRCFHYCAATDVVIVRSRDTVQCT